jgi:2-amino-4-hydroxy-6-hydroxymethyldihydropteridine diphosphokinase
MSTLALIGLGSNLGDRKATLDAALGALAQTPGVALRAASRYHETAPIGGPSGQGAFLNAAARLRTTLSATALLGALRKIESRFGRIRSERWAARTLDLDLLMYGELISDAADLTLPHPRMAVRRFVLAPLSEVAEDVRDPVTHRTILQLFHHLDRRPSYVAIGAPPGESRSFVVDRLASELGAAQVRQLVLPRDPMDVEERRRYLDDFAARVRQLAARRWPADDRWLVTDFCLDLERSRPPLWTQHWTSLAEHAEVAAAQWGLYEALRPTFAVVLDRKFVRKPALAPFPILAIQPDDPNLVVGEVLAACNATRA